MKKIYFLLIILLSSSFQLFAQNKAEEKQSQIREDGAYFTAELMPEFPGGQETMMEFVRRNVKYPDEALAKNIGGSVIIQFVIETDGSIGRQKVLKNVHPLLDAEAFRVVSLMPAWTPGKQNGKVVPVIFNIPVIFKQSQSGSGAKPVTRNELKGFVVSGDKPNKKTSLEGTWQFCLFANPLKDGKYQVAVAPCLKVFTSKRFSTIMLGAGSHNSFFNISGKYKRTSRNTFTEYIENATTNPKRVGEKITLTYEFLTSNLIKVTFKLPNIQSTFTEHWVKLGHEQLGKN